ncbi:MAG: class III cytochrome C family protein [Burkholderiales bacterium]|nr:class III cytochrome C family protein [Burkholderiales bacterium]
MKRPGLLPSLVAVNLLALLALVFLYPQWMISPGPLVKAHAPLADDCFACHQSWRGASSQRCMDCHRPADIGLRSTLGQPLAQTVGGKAKVGFHQQLVEDQCMACHTDHQGSRLSQLSSRSFSHELLQPATREQCAHCHSAPRDDLHRQMDAPCQQCHDAKAWKPAQFDHERHFVLDRDHQAPCSTCHLAKDFKRTTCYGCHEHTPQNIRREHEEEGIRQFERCVECHRDPREEPRKPGKGHGRKRDKDDD